MTFAEIDLYWVHRDHTENANVLYVDEIAYPTGQIQTDSFITFFNPIAKPTTIFGQLTASMGKDKTYCAVVL